MTVMRPLFSVTVKMSDFEHIRKEDADDFEDEEMATQSDFALVIFHNVLETYPIDANIECNYTVTRRLYGKPSDWVGLYRVGWGNCREYVMFEWSKLPQDYKQGSDVNASVMFNCKYCCLVYMYGNITIHKVQAFFFHVNYWVLLLGIIIHCEMETFLKTIELLF